MLVPSLFVRAENCKQVILAWLQFSVHAGCGCHTCLVPLTELQLNGREGGREGRGGERRGREYIIKTTVSVSNVHVGLVQVKYTFPHLESVVFSSRVGIGNDSA